MRKTEHHELSDIQHKKYGDDGKGQTCSTSLT